MFNQEEIKSLENKIADNTKRIKILEQIITNLIKLLGFSASGQVVGKDDFSPFFEIEDYYIWVFANENKQPITREEFNLLLEKLNLKIEKVPAKGECLKIIKK